MAGEHGPNEALVVADHEAHAGIAHQILPDGLAAVGFAQALLGGLLETPGAVVVGRLEGDGSWFGRAPVYAAPVHGMLLGREAPP